MLVLLVHCILMRPLVCASSVIEVRSECDCPKLVKLLMLAGVLPGTANELVELFWAPFFIPVAGNCAVAFC